MEFIGETDKKTEEEASSFIILSDFSKNSPTFFQAKGEFSGRVAIFQRAISGVVSTLSVAIAA